MLFPSGTVEAGLLQIFPVAGWAIETNAGLQNWEIVGTVSQF